MLPTITVFGKTIAMYGLMITIGIFIGVILALFRSKKHDISKDDIIFSSCYGGIGLIIGAKLLYIITIIPIFVESFDLIISDITLLLHSLSAGFVFYGGLIGAAVGYYLYCKKYNIDFPKLIDLIAPSIPIIHGIGRIGCFFAGCCYGMAYDGPFHIVFKNSTVAPNGVPLFPIQLVESILNISAGVMILIYTRKPRRQGQAIGIYIIYYSIMRFVLEFFRGDAARGIALNISTSQWISILLLPIGFYMFLRVKPKKISQ
ncbi:MAG TPA: prolipoprotein diacylglyceryl transferase [Clostridiales bacterium]|nr:prolipoprotein diacylglyceryl transferase [Clostridiales bacterium]